MYHSKPGDSPREVMLAAPVGQLLRSCLPPTSNPQTGQARESSGTLLSQYVQRTGFSSRSPSAARARSWTNGATPMVFTQGGDLRSRPGRPQKGAIRHTKSASQFGHEGSGKLQCEIVNHGWQSGHGRELPSRCRILEGIIPSLLALVKPRGPLLMTPTPPTRPLPTPARSRARCFRGALSRRTRHSSIKLT